MHSLPVGSTRTKVSVSVASVSSGHTPHARYIQDTPGYSSSKIYNANIFFLLSYADIARHAAALQTQQQGRQQHAVYREQLQFSRENTPGNTKESVSSNEDYFYNPELDTVSFPPVQPQPEPGPEQTNYNSSHTKSSNNNNSNQASAGSSITNNNPPPPPAPATQQDTHPTDSQPKCTVPGDSESSDRSSSVQCNKSKLRQTPSDPSLSLPPVVILQNNEASDTAETGFTFGFEVIQ